MKKISLFMLLAIMLAACSKETAMPHNQVRLAVNSTELSLTEISPANRTQALLAILDTLPQGKRYATVTAGTAIPKKERADINTILLSKNFPKERIIWATGNGKELQIAFRTVYTEHSLPFKSRGEPHWYSAVTVSSGHGFSVEGNIAAQMANIEELSTPENFGLANPLAASGAVERYQKGQVKGLSEQSIEAGKSGE